MAAPTGQQVYDSLIPLFRNQCSENATVRKQVATENGLSLRESLIFEQLCINKGKYIVSDEMKSLKLIKKEKHVTKKLVEQLVIDIDDDVVLHPKIKQLSCIRNPGTTSLSKYRRNIALILNKIEHRVLDDIPDHYINKCVTTIASIEDKIEKAKESYYIDNTKILEEIDIKDTINMATGNNKTNEVDHIAHHFQKFDKTNKKCQESLQSELDKTKNAFKSLSIGKWNEAQNKWESDLIFTFWSFEKNRKISIILNDELYEHLVNINKKITTFKNETVILREKIERKRKSKIYQKHLSNVTETLRARRHRKKYKKQNDKRKDEENDINNNKTKNNKKNKGNKVNKVNKVNKGNKKRIKKRRISVLDLLHHHSTETSPLNSPKKKKLKIATDIDKIEKFDLIINEYSHKKDDVGNENNNNEEEQDYDDQQAVDEMKEETLKETPRC